MISSMMMSVDARCSVSGANWGGRELQWSENGMWQVGADEVQGGWPGNQLSFFIRLEVPPPSCIEEVDFWVRGLSVDPPFGSRTCGKGLEGLQEEWQTPYKISSSPRCSWGGFTRHGGARGGWRRRGTVWRERCGGMEGVSERAKNP